MRTSDPSRDLLELLLDDLRSLRRPNERGVPQIPVRLTKTEVLHRYGLRSRFGWADEEIERVLALGLAGGYLAETETSAGWSYHATPRRLTPSVDTY
jgi:hypothetical protein